MKKLNVLVTLAVSEDQKELFEHDNCNLVFRSSSNLCEEDVLNADIIIGNIPLDFLDHIEKLRYLHLYMAGSDQFAAHAKIRDKVLLTNSSGCFGLGISEYMIGGVLQFYKNFHKYYRNQTKALWRSEGEMKSIHGANVLVVGLGDIGSCFAERMHALGAKVVGIKRTVGEKPDYLEELHQMNQLDRCIPQADIIALCLPQSSETIHVINQQRLSLMKSDALLINVGRGSAVDTKALYDTLKEQKIMGAVLDVLEEEPLAFESPLWKLENLIITPHISGGRNLAYTRQLLVNLAAANLNAFLNDKPLKNVVDYQTGYRKSL